MASRAKQDTMGKLIANVEAALERLRTEARKRARAAGLSTNLEAAAKQLRKRAAAAAAQAEKYVHGLRKGLEPKATARRPKKKRARKA